MGDLGQIVPMKYNPRDEDSIKAVIAKANVVINLIGRDYETRNFSFEEVNHSMVQQLATISKEHGVIMRFIQVSCLGASSSSPSRFLRTKAVAEEAVLSELLEVAQVQGFQQVVVESDSLKVITVLNGTYADSLTLGMIAEDVL
ncbi:NADH dehydrogenase [ubiquinone] 1 alpha subcomplex subunit 9, mitochondrial-like [Malus sylvestris]|uniref:NADH dehydrogenase [ubiquinone] 1 alpha subcomplex subunit 9, mitochondrial-like n=1 Tax=Malus sylvestris TaxID=3752 RepID=UPI0021AC668C|nr:NADH dehydrogenase [ubiquinone] 1 alpha subcomplex subunit 9, mitochondrial-like [Malus sylvestris]